MSAGPDRPTAVGILLLPGLLGAWLLCAPSAAEPDGLVARGDAAFAARARSMEAGKAEPAGVTEAIQAYREALSRDPQSAAIRWRLLRALHYRGDFSRVSPEAARDDFATGRTVGEEGVERLAKQLGEALHRMAPARRAASLAEAGVPPGDAARLYFWTAIHLGAWSRDAGLLASVREGVASRLHDYARLSADLDPGVDEGGALRLLGRLHASLPRVPFISGWVDRSRAIPLLERALSLAPEHPGNRYLLGLTLLELTPESGERSQEALSLLRSAAESQPREESRAEDIEIRRLAREALEERGAPDGARAPATPPGQRAAPGPVASLGR